MVIKFVKSAGEGLKAAGSRLQIPVTVTPNPKSYSFFCCANSFDREGAPLQQAGFLDVRKLIAEVLEE